MIATQIAPIPLSKRPEFVYLVISRLFAGLAGIALATTLGLQVYRLTRDPLAIGLMGLIEAVPALSLALFGGYIADHYDRRKITLVTSVIIAACVAAVLFFSLNTDRFGILSLYVLIFIYGLAAGFNRPAFSAFEQQIIPNDQVARATSVLSSVSLTGSLIGGPLAGFLIDSFGRDRVDTHGIPAAYALALVLLSLSFICVALIKPRPMPTPTAGENIWQSLRAGLRFVFHSQPLVGSMALDLFAVLFGGAMRRCPSLPKIFCRSGPPAWAGCARPPRWARSWLCCGPRAGRPRTMPGEIYCWPSPRLGSASSCLRSHRTSGCPCWPCSSAACSMVSA